MLLHTRQMHAHWHTHTPNVMDTSMSLEMEGEPEKNEGQKVEDGKLRDEQREQAEESEMKM